MSKSYRNNGFQRPERAMYFSIAPNYWLGNGVDHIRITDSHELNFSGKKPQVANLCHQLTMNHRLRRPLIIPYFGSFASIDSFYYWLMMKRKDTPQAETIRSIHGPEVRRYFIEHDDKKKQSKTIPNMRAMIVHAYWLRVMSDRDLQIAMANNLMQYDMYHYSRSNDVYGDGVDKYIPVRPTIANWLCPAIDAIGDALRVRDDVGEVVMNGNQVVMCDKPEFPFGIMTGMDTLPNYQELFVQIAPELHSRLVERVEFQYQLEQRRLRQKQKRDAKLLRKQSNGAEDSNLDYTPTDEGDVIDQIMQIGIATSESQKEDAEQLRGVTSYIARLDESPYQEPRSESSMFDGDKIVFGTEMHDVYLEGSKTVLLGSLDEAVSQLTTDMSSPELSPINIVALAEKAELQSNLDPTSENGEVVVKAYRHPSGGLIVEVDDGLSQSDLREQATEAPDQVIDNDQPADDERFSLPG